MDYTIGQLAELAGVSTRTLRYYDRIGLLKPLYVDDSGYRWYGERELDLLQQILFYRERGFALAQISDLLYSENFDLVRALEDHLMDLERRQAQTERLIQTVRRTLAYVKGEYPMSDTEKFEAFKHQTIQRNEELYGTELREKYGSAAIDASNRKLLHMTEEEYSHFQTLGNQILEDLNRAVSAGLSPSGEEGRRIFQQHREWLCMTWNFYHPEAHKSLAETYTADSRFQGYYDRKTPGCAEFLKQAILFWADASVAESE